MKTIKQTLVHMGRTLGYEGSEDAVANIMYKSLRLAFFGQLPKKEIANIGGVQVPHQNNVGAIPFQKIGKDLTGYERLEYAVGKTTAKSLIQYASLNMNELDISALLLADSSQAKYVSDWCKAKGVKTAKEAWSSANDNQLMHLFFNSAAITDEEKEAFGLFCSDDPDEKNHLRQIFYLYETGQRTFLQFRVEFSLFIADSFKTTLEKTSWIRKHISPDWQE